MNRGIKIITAVLSLLILIIAFFGKTVKWEFDLGGTVGAIGDAFGLSAGQSSEGEIMPLAYDYDDYLEDALDDFGDAMDALDEELEELTEYSYWDVVEMGEDDAIWFMLSMVFPAAVLLVFAVMDAVIGKGSPMTTGTAITSISVLPFTLLMTLFLLCPSLEASAAKMADFSPTIWFWIMLLLEGVCILLSCMSMAEYNRYKNISRTPIPCVYGPPNQYGSGSSPNRNMQQPNRPPMQNNPQPRPYPQPASYGKPVIRCVSGEYQGAEFPCDGKIVIGRDSKVSNIILSGEKVSRRHCTVSFNMAKGTYTVVDYSTNGVTANPPGYKLPTNTPVELPRGTTISAGSERDRFMLM